MYRYKSISQGKEKKTYYKIGALSVFAIIIVLFSRVQISIIDSYKPRLASCSYFDNKNLLLYETMFIFNDCPELEFEILDNGMSHYKGIEVYEGGIWTFGGDLVIDEYTSAEILFDVYVQYDGEELVSHSVQITLLAKLSGNGKTYIYYESLHSETTIFNDEGIMEITRKSSFKDPVLSEETYNIYDLTHYSFIEDDYRYQKHIASLSVNGEWSISRQTVDDNNELDEVDLGVITYTEEEWSGYSNLEYESSLDTRPFHFKFTKYLNDESEKLTLYSIRNHGEFYAVDKQYEYINGVPVLTSEKFGHRLDVTEVASTIYSPSYTDDIYIEDVGQINNEFVIIRPTVYGRTMFEYSSGVGNQPINQRLKHLINARFMEYETILYQNETHKYIFPYNPFLSIE